MASLAHLRLLKTRKPLTLIIYYYCIIRRVCVRNSKSSIVREISSDARNKGKIWRVSYRIFQHSNNPSSRFFCKSFFFVEVIPEAFQYTQGLKTRIFDLIKSLMCIFSVASDGVLKSVIVDGGFVSMCWVYLIFFNMNFCIYN